MSPLDLVAVLLTLSALFGWVNRKLALLRHTIGLLVMGVAASLILLGVEAVVPDHRASGLIREVLGRIDFGASADETSPGAVALLLVQEAGGGLALGAVTGYAAYRAMRAIDD